MNDEMNRYVSVGYKLTKVTGSSEIEDIDQFDAKECEDA